MFNRLVGNQTGKAVLTRLVKAGRVPNSLIFAGRDGVGKQQFAVELARTFICTEPTAERPCDKCPACGRIGPLAIPESVEKKKDEFQKVFFGGHGDLGTVLPYKRTILVNAIRDLEKHANFLPNEARARFFIIDDADKMNDEASNALLKTLEEPPPTSHIILITSKPDSLSATIRSRCQLIRFGPVPTDEIEKYLIGERAFSPDEAKLAARLSAGSVGRALSINAGDFRAIRDRMIGVLRDAILTGSIASMLQTSEAINSAKLKESFEESIDVLQSLIHDIWTIRISGDCSRVVNIEIEEELAELAKASGRMRLDQWIGEIDKMRENFAVNINRRVATDALFVSMASGRSN
jgi:DNA polymerase-3 subunit delta'